MVLANIWFPNLESRKRVIAAISTLPAVGAPAESVLTIPAGYPPIDRSIPNPVLAIFAAQNDATLVANGANGFAIAGDCGFGTAPTGAGEFRITGARTLGVWNLINETQVVLIIYVAKGSGQET